MDYIDHHPRSQTCLFASGGLFQIEYMYTYIYIYTYEYNPKVFDAS